MGTGKSSVGRLLALTLGCPHFDTDLMIAKRLGRSVARIFAELGEARFRDEETAVLETFAAEKQSVIVTGGGVVLRPGNIPLLHQLGTVVGLTADLPILLRRLKRRPDRPLLQTPNPAETAETLLRAREPLYQQAADFIIDTSALNHEQVAQSIQDALALSR